MVTIDNLVFALRCVYNRCSWFVLFVPCTRLMKRGRKLVHENMSIRLRPAACVFLSLLTRNLRKPSNFFYCTMYLVSHSVLCHCLVKQHSQNDKKEKKDCQMSVYHKADPGELIQWVPHESRSSAASNSGLIRIGTQPRTDDAWHQWLMPAARRRHPRFFGHFWPSVWPSSRSNFDLGPSPLDSTEKIFHIRAYDFGVQFSFNQCCAVPVNNRVRSGYGKSGKSMEFVFSISRPGKSMEICEKLWKLQKRFGTFCLLPEKILKTESVPPSRALVSCCRAFDRKQFEGWTVFSLLFLFIVPTA